MTNQIASEDTPEYNASPKTSVTLKLEEDAIISQALSILHKRMKKIGDVMTTPEHVENYLKLKYSQLNYEVFGILYLDGRNKFLLDEELFRGTVDGASVHVREVFRNVISTPATALILYHNHPSGNTEPSSADRLITERLVKAASLFEIRILDHLIIGNDCYSFAKQGLL